MAKKIDYLTPPGVAVYPKITTPDNTGEYADGKYKTFLELTEPQLARVEADLKKAMSKMTFKVKNPKVPIKELNDGRKVLVFKSKFIPNVYDARNVQLVDKWNPPSKERLAALSIGPGSIIRVGANFFAYDKGLSLQLESVQVIDLKGGAGSESPFEETEGWSAEDEDEGTSGSPFESHGSDEDEEDIDL